MDCDKMRGRRALRIAVGIATLVLAGGAGAAVSATIDYPKNNSSFLQGEMIMFSGDASGGIAPYNYTWTSNIDGLIGSASTIYNSPFAGNRTYIFTFSLSPGTHTITMTVNDSGGLTNSTSTNITVNRASTANISGQSATGTMAWNVSNFPAFWKENSNTSETLKVASLSGRIITGNSLWYNTTKQLIPYKVYSATGKTDWYWEYCGGYYSASGCYSKIGWFGRGYVALKGKAKKPTRLVLEQNETESKTLTLGETWDMGDGYTLKLMSIDAKALPIQAWIRLNKSGTLLDDKVIANGSVYTYVERSIGGESDVPMFVTYFDNISTNSVRLKYTWLISNNIIELSTADRFGNLEVISSTDNNVILTNKDTTIILSQGSTITIADGLRFRVNDTPTLDYYPEMTKYSTYAAVKGNDIVGVYNNAGTWALWNTTSNAADIVGFGFADTTPVVGDWNGDSKTDVGIYNKGGNNFLIKTDSGATAIGLGWTGVTPVAGDWNGDGKDKVGVYDNAGTWALWNTTSNAADIVGFGFANTTPVVGDWNGDGKTDVGIYNKGGNNFLIRNTSAASGFDIIGLGWTGVTPVVGDWNGDGKDEVGVYDNAGTWALWNSTSSAADIMGFGWTNTTPVAGDWNGNSRTEVGIYNKGGNNFLIKKDSGFDIIGLGWEGVTPVVGRWN